MQITHDLIDKSYGFLLQKKRAEDQFCLDDHGVMVILIGDTRKNGKYTPIFNDILNFRIGTLKSIIIKAQHNVFSESKSYEFGNPEKRKLFIPIMHEYCLIFQK